MDKLLKRYINREITPYVESYLTFRYPHREYAYIMASATLHHLIDEEKRDLYPKLRKALTESGCLIVGDYYVSPEEAIKQLKQYNLLVSDGIDLRNGKCYFDVPTTVDNEKGLLLEAGFASVDTIWRSVNFSIIVAHVV